MATGQEASCDPAWKTDRCLKAGKGSNSLQVTYLWWLLANARPERVNRSMRSQALYEANQILEMGYMGDPCISLTSDGGSHAVC